jgi:hypothetical protein
MRPPPPAEEEEEEASLSEHVVVVGPAHTTREQAQARTQGKPLAVAWPRSWPHLAK